MTSTRLLPPSDDTIMARSTAAGAGAVAIVRVSGPGCRRLLERLFVSREARPDWSWGRLHLGTIGEPETGRAIDECLAVFFPGPRSYTGQDVAEFHLHGGAQIVRETLVLFARHGVRPAEPGEFTFRAFLNGRMDLCQAEGVADLIGSDSEAALRASRRLIEGALGEDAAGIRRLLVEVLAQVEARLDFPDEELAPESIEWMDKRLRQAQQRCGDLAGTYARGRLVREGLTAVILGRPNVGKSSLLNRLLGQDRAMVSDIPGTTRDFVTEHIDVAGVCVRLVDTAGLGEGGDALERLGVERAEQQARQADLLLVVLDASLPLTDLDRQVLDRLDAQPGLAILNKADLPQTPRPERAIAPGGVESIVLSCATGEGFDELRRALAAMVTRMCGASGGGEGVVVTRQRQRDALLRCAEAVQHARHALDGVQPLELAGQDLRDAVDALSDLAGRTTPDEVLAEVFGRFCIGK